MELVNKINAIIKDKGYKSFLLIGDDINILNGIVCDRKQMEDHTFLKGNLRKFDVILIDGIHTADQVETDIIDAWRDVSSKGVILVHDVKPHDEAMQRVPREQTIWTGDVWRAWDGFKKIYPKIKVKYIDETYGLGLINKSKAKISKGFISDITFEQYQANKGWEVK